MCSGDPSELTFVRAAPCDYTTTMLPLPLSPPAAIATAAVTTSTAAIAAIAAATIGISFRHNLRPLHDSLDS